MEKSQIKIPRDCGFLHMFDKGQKWHYLGFIGAERDCNLWTVASKIQM